MSDPYPKSKQLARGERRYRRKVASPKQWAVIRAEKGYYCRLDPRHRGSGHTGGIQYHHLVSRAQGGDDVADNIVPLCRHCHERVTGRKQVILDLLALALSDAEYAYVIGKLGEGAMGRGQEQAVWNFEKCGYCDCTPGDCRSPHPLHEAHKTAVSCAHCGSAEPTFCADPHCPPSGEGQDDREYFADQVAGIAEVFEQAGYEVEHHPSGEGQVPIIDVPLSTCECGHFNSVHEGTHGACELEACGCERFTWAVFHMRGVREQVIQKPYTGPSGEGQTSGGTA